VADLPGQPVAFGLETDELLALPVAHLTQLAALPAQIGDLAVRIVERHERLPMVQETQWPAVHSRITCTAR